ncbi:MAG: FAD-binding protein, partial [Bacteroidales bacterium]|nr:FAD-binding protein [Bacteroidales bacterium]
PRDIVARSIYRQMKLDGRPYVTLSLKHLDSGMILKRFPFIYAKCKEAGYDLTQEIPVAPAAHYSVGGVLSNHNGRTDIRRLYVCGEVAATGIMGANRLASNSLIECLVFANRAIEDSVKEGTSGSFPAFGRQFIRNGNNAQLYAGIKSRVSEIMNSHAGIIRSEDGLREGLKLIAELECTVDRKEAESCDEGKREYYIEASRRLLCVARLIMSPALLRKESRGGHYREDYPCTEEAYTLHSVQRYGEEVTTAPVNRDYFGF